MHQREKSKQRDHGGNPVEQGKKVEDERESVVVVGYKMCPSNTTLYLYKKYEKTEVCVCVCVWCHIFCFEWWGLFFFPFFIKFGLSFSSEEERERGREERERVRCNEPKRFLCSVFLRIH